MKGFKKIVYIYNVLWDGFYYLFVFYRFWFRGCWRSCFGIFLWIVFFCSARRYFRVGACLFLGLGCLGDSIELLYFLIRWILRGWLRIYFYIYFILIKDWGKRGFWFFLEKFNLYIKFIKNRFRFFFGKIIWIRIMSIN